MVIPQTVRGSKRFYWDIVLNNYTLEECESVKVIFDEIADAYIIGKEVGSQGTPHLQMMIKLKKGNYKSYLIKKLGSRYSIREGRNIDAMKAYCMKDGDIYSSLNVERIQASRSLDEKVNEEFDFELVDNRKMYEKFLKEVKPDSIDKEAYDFLENWLRNKCEEENYVRRKP